MKKLFFLAILCAAATSLHAAGFRAALQSAKQQGMGHVGVGMDVGPASLFFNPGAMGMNGNHGISLNGSAVLSKIGYNTPGTTYETEIEKNTGTPIALYGTFGINDKMSGGLGVYTPYGSTVEWPNDWAGRYVSQSIELASFFIQPTVSYKVNDQFGIGAGFIYALGNVTLKRGAPLLNNDGMETDITLENDKAATGTGYNVGVYYQPNSDLSFGVNYRSKVEVEAEDGNVAVENLPQAAAGAFSATKFGATLPLPAELSFGAGFDVNERFTLAADVNVAYWSAYEQLVFNYNGTLGGSTSTTIPQNWENVLKVNVGGEYDVNENFIVRAGGNYDQSPVPDAHLSPITPDTDRLSGTLGFSYLTNSNFSIDGSVIFLDGKERTVQAINTSTGLGQRYKVAATIPSLGLNYSFN